MKISAKDIGRWAQSREAQGDLPRLIRRLAVQAGTVTAIAFPAGQSVSRPSWDGQILSSEGDPWVPAGRSLWELSVRHDVATKAEEDYVKRTQETDPDTRQDSTLVVLTARLWAKKRIGRLASEPKANGKTSAPMTPMTWKPGWRRVRQSPWPSPKRSDSPAAVSRAPTAIAKLGVPKEPPISSSAFFADRQDAKDRLISDLRRRIANGPSGTYAIRADSVAEATPLSALLLLDTEDLSDQALVVTDETGWRFSVQSAAFDSPSPPSRWLRGPRKVLSQSFL